MKEPEEVAADDDGNPYISLADLKAELKAGWIMVADVVADLDRADHKHIAPLCADSLEQVGRTGEKAAEGGDTCNDQAEGGVVHGIDSWSTVTSPQSSIPESER
jgi:hypothetical protein